MPTIQNPTAPATEAQINFYGSLAAQFTTRMGGSNPAVATETAKAWAKAQNKGKVSAAIDELKKKVDALPKPEIKPVLPGYYALGTETYLVVVAKSSGNTYAKQWTVKPGNVKATWVYAPGVIKSLAGSNPMTLEEAKAFGHSHGYCIRCGAQLTDPKSVEAGIGPICAGYWG